jgi:hypothetical protein
MIEYLSHQHLLIAALLMGGAGLIAMVPSVLYLFYERWASDRERRKASAQSAGDASRDKPKAAHA